jgi:REP element-mobilizing transposase RayT
MARPLRIEFPGAFYHVVNRGNQRNRIFFSPSHYEMFLEKLSVFSEQFDISVKCYCIMPNHFHLYLQTREGNLSRFMQSLLTSFCYSLNRLRGKSGHIFQGRFKCHLVEDAAYSLVVSRYIHLNPVRVEEAREVSFAGRRRMLESFKWSSYAAYAGKAEVPEWLDVSSVLGNFGSKDDKLRRKAYVDYVEEGLLKDTGNPFGSATSQIILGGEEFTERIRRKYLMNLNVTDHKEQRDLSKMRRSFLFEEILSIASKYFKADADELLRKSSRSEARKALMYLACKYCRGRMSLTEIGRRMSIGQSGFVRSKNRFESEMGDNRKVALNIRKIEEDLKSIAGV